MHGMKVLFLTELDKNAWDKIRTLSKMRRTKLKQQRNSMHEMIFLFKSLHRLQCI